METDSHPGYAPFESDQSPTLVPFGFAGGGQRGTKGPSCAAQLAGGAEVEQQVVWVTDDH